jgi:Tfp pilus assembly protein PilO
MKLAGKLSQRLDYRTYYNRVQQLAQQPRMRVSGLVSLTLFAVAFFGLFAILPTFKTISALKKEIKESEEMEIGLQKKIAAMDEAQRVYLQIIDEIKIIEKVIPNGVEFERLAWQVQWTANSNQVEIVSGGFGEFPVKGSDNKNKEESQAIEINMIVAGSYTNIRAFLKNLTQIDRLIVADLVSINSKSAQKQPGTINANIKAKAYYLPEL